MLAGVQRREVSGRSLSAGSHLRLWSWRKRRQRAYLTWAVWLDEPCPLVAVLPAKMDIHTYCRAATQGPTGIAGRGGKVRWALAANFSLTFAVVLLHQLMWQW